LKPKILIYTDWFPPAFKAGGPIQSIYQLTQLLKEYYEVYVITTTEDLNDSIENQLPIKNQFVTFNGVQVNYLNSSHRSISHLKRFSEVIQPQFFFFNGLFNRYFYKYLLFHFIRKTNESSIISLRGMLKPSALVKKERKKKIYIRILRWLVKNKKITFHCTSKEEERDLITNFGENQKLVVLPNIPFLSQNRITQEKSDKLKLVYAARIHPIKNLHYLISALSQVKSSLKFSIIGVIDDKDYWLECKKQLNQLPKHIEVEVLGDMSHHDLMNNLPNHNAYILPTLGENFGHSIFEAFAAGLPVIISDQTPWRDLEAQKVGFDIPLTRSEHFIRAIEFFAECSEEEWREWSHNAREYSENFFSKQNFEKAYSELFKNKVKIGLVAPITITRYKGGISVFAEHFLKHKAEFKKHDIEIQFLNTCKVPRTNASIGKFRWINLRNYIYFFFKTIKSIRQYRIKLLHYNTSVGLSLLKDAFTANVLKIFTNVDTILHIHFTDIHELKKENVYRKVLIFFLKRIHSVVVLSDKLRQDLVTLGLENKKLMVIRNYSILNFKKELSVKRVKRDILFIGSVDRRKGILDLFEAIHDFPEKLNWHLHIAGDFTSEAFKLLFFSKLKELNLTKRVTLHGYVSDEAKHKLFEMSSILVLPSYSEGMPLSILEGLSAGCAIVATNVGANKETIKSVTNLLQPGDLNAIKQELEKLLTDVQYLELRQKQSLELSKEFSFKKFVDQITPLYEVSTL